MTKKDKNVKKDKKISIHTALAGCDAELEQNIADIEISIHTALAGCDIVRGVHMIPQEYFNPHSPRRL